MIGIELGSYMIPLNLHKTSFDENFVLILGKGFI